MTRQRVAQPFAAIVFVVTMALARSASVTGSTRRSPATRSDWLAGENLEAELHQHQVCVPAVWATTRCCGEHRKTGERRRVGPKL